MKPAISVENLGKCYRVSHESSGRKSYRTLRESLADLATAPVRRFRNIGTDGASAENFWALKDISFEVNPGEVVGIIGRNGAGKSTLLKILSRITKPSTGQVAISGRVGSLLEVGTGFHPELTGRENIYLNGSILGMQHSEIVRQFDAIIDFSGVERFLDTPVKRYSSGMYVRLAFAVAAHLRPEILIVDEVLAVGDATFQKKCLGKMGEVARNGRTVLFVSHNMAAITRLCRRVVLLGTGQVLRDGPAEQVARFYLQSDLGTTGSREWRGDRRPGDHVVRLNALRVRNKGGKITEALDIREPVGIEMDYEVLEGGQMLAPNLHFFNEEGVNVFATIDQDPEWRRRVRPVGRYVSTAWVPGNLFAEGTIAVGAAVTTLSPMNVRFYEQEAVAFQVIDSLDGNSARGDYAGPMPGIVRPMIPWTTCPDSDGFAGTPA